MCESVIGSSGAMRGLQTGSHWCESVAPSSMTLEQRGGREGHAKGPGCDGYLWGRVTASSKGRWRVVGTVCSQREPLFLQGSLLFAFEPLSPPLPTTQPQPSPGRRRICTNCCLQSSHPEPLVSHIATHTQTSTDKETDTSQVTQAWIKT